MTLPDCTDESAKSARKAAFIHFPPLRWNWECHRSRRMHRRNIKTVRYLATAFQGNDKNIQKWVNEKRHISPFIQEKKPFCITTLITVISSGFAHTVSSKPVTDEVGRTGAGLSTERAKASWTTRWKNTRRRSHPFIRHMCLTEDNNGPLVCGCECNAENNLRLNKLFYFL